ncbi:hypothetical protein [Cellulomonas dongxiuzhuiae]|uniref:hypothetical protein n=1 Tax=Cellulomonas dongxiuzhuiae TaxID=2819979 RepID=UPI001AAEC479|nr:hypothetical protein [Cellulomonas dongxiuzhuiae]MBO3089492.1 hypothetical protein [Cellulomonas dongxiuzhuiae]
MISTQVLVDGDQGRRRMHCRRVPRGVRRQRHPISGVATACDTRVEFARDGVALEVTTGDAKGRQVDESFALLTPPGLDTGALTSELDIVTDTLLVGDADVNVQRVGDALTADLD